MSILNNAAVLLLGEEAGGGGGYTISRSLRFNSSDSAYCSRVPSTAGNRTTWTWAGWVKRSALSNALNYTLFSSTTDSYNLSYNQIQFEAGDKIRLKFADGGATTLDLTTNAVFRDASAWYHILIAVDTTQSAQQSRVSIYINGALQALTGTYPGQNANTIFNKASASHHLAGSPPFSEYFSGYLADIHFIDGQALTPSSFTEVSATTGQLVPKAYTGSYGTNGFQLKFADNSNNTATTLGKDTSGNGNNWTPNNLSVTAGAGNDSLTDTPTSYGTDTGAGGSVRGNYATLNPLDQGSNITLSNGNLDITTSIGWRSIRSTFGVTSGKWYWEVTVTSGSQTLIGIAKTNASLASNIGSDASGWSYYSANGNKFNNNSQIAYGATYTSGDIIGITFDADNGTLSFYKNNTSQGTAYTGLVSGPYFPSFGIDTSVTAVFNFGQRPFAYTAPSGFKALCDTNLPAPVVAKPNTVMDVKLYTGNSSTQTISGLGFSPDFTWIKCRNSSVPSHCLFDTIRGATKGLHSNETVAEWTAASTLTSFNSDGFSLGSDGFVNDSTRTYVAWAWDAGSSTVTNTQGSITSQVRANASAGFSIVSATAPSSYVSFSFGHGLGVKPAMVIYKERTGTASWWVWHQGLPNAATGRALNLNSTSGELNGTYWGTIDSSIVTSNATQTTLSAPFVAYCFAPVAGYSSFGSYTGNGSADGPFVYTGFRPAFVMIKRTDTTGDWIILDDKRLGYNADNYRLFANLANGDNATVVADLTSNGFKLRTASVPTLNASGGSYIYAAWASAPFAYSRAR